MMRLCDGSGHPPRRYNRCGKAVCPECGRYFEPRCDGLLRRHGRRD